MKNNTGINVASTKHEGAVRFLEVVACEEFEGKCLTNTTIS